MESNRKHFITLSNGKRMVIEEGEECISVAQVDPDDTPWYICTISKSGTLVMPNSADAGEHLCEGL